MQDQITSTQELKDQIKDMEKRIEEINQERHAIETERDEVKQHASELLEKVKLEVEGKEFMIDRRMINTFLVQYINPKSDAATKKKMLDAMSKILGFSMEEKQALGLVER